MAKLALIKHADGRYEVFPWVRRVVDTVLDVHHELRRGIESGSSLVATREQLADAVGRLSPEHARLLLAKIMDAYDTADDVYEEPPPAA